MRLIPAGVRYLEPQAAHLVKESMYPMCARQLLLNLRALPTEKSGAESEHKLNWPTARLIGKLLKEVCIGFCWRRKVARVQLKDRGIWPLK